MNVRFLETFVWVARLRSFSATAERMNATQAAISARIASLEDELGVRLFDRSGREVTLTSEGLTALERAETIVRLTQRLCSDMRDPATLRGTLRVGVIDTISLTWLVQLIELVRRRYPNVRLQLYAETSLVIADHIKRHEVDLGLLMGPVIGNGVTNIDLCSYGCVWTAAPTFPIANGPLGPRELGVHPIISFPPGSKPHQTLLRQFCEFEEDEVLFYTSNSLATIIRMVRDGIGVAALPTALIQEELAQEKLRILDVEPSFPPIPLHACFVEGGHSLLASTVAELARDVAAEFCARLPDAVAWCEAPAMRDTRKLCDSSESF